MTVNVFRRPQPLHLPPSSRASPSQRTTAPTAPAREPALSNAIKYTPAGGLVVIHAERAAPELLAQRLPSALHGLVVSVRDTGPGIPEADRERVFEKYSLIRGPRAGRYSTGLGLAFSRRAVVAHGGALWVEATASGAAFRLLLPVLP